MDKPALTLPAFGVGYAGCGIANGIEDSKSFFAFLSLTGKQSEAHAYVDSMHTVAQPQRFYRILSP